MSLSVLISMPVAASSNTNVHIDDSKLTRKESVEQFLRENPQYVDKIMTILEEKDALNSDGTIKENLGISESERTAKAFTGYEYEFAGAREYYSSHKETTAGDFDNKSSTSMTANISQTVTYGVELQADVTIQSKVALESAFEIQSGVNFGYKVTYAASQMLGVTIVVPPNTRTVIKVYPIEICYTFREQYYVLGVPIGSSNLVGVFKPVGAKWTAYEV